MTIDRVHSYENQTRELLAKRALGLLTPDDEAEIAEQLEDLWRLLSEQERAQIEAWLVVELQPVTHAAVDEIAASGTVEVEDS